jgi:hypothetical protein
MCTGKKRPFPSLPIVASGSLSYAYQGLFENYPATQQGQ